MYSEAEKKFLEITANDKQSAKDVSHLSPNQRRMRYARDLIVLSSLAITVFLLIDVIARLIVVPPMMIYQKWTDKELKIISPKTGREIEVNLAMKAENIVRNLYGVLYIYFPKLLFSAIWIGLSSIAYLLFPDARIHAFISLILASIHLAGAYIYSRQRR